MSLLLSLLFLSIWLPMSSACSCLQQPPPVVFCDAKWGKTEVSHVKVLTKNLIHIGSTGFADEFHYKVQHLDVLKYPPGQTALATKIISPKDSATCGVSIDAGKEYLLAGGFKNSDLSIYLCTHIGISGPHGNEWKGIPADFIKQLRNTCC